MILANRFTHGVLHRWFTNRSLGYAYYTVWPTVQETPRPKFIASVAPTKSAEEERAYFYTPPTHYGRGAGLSIAGETLHNRETTMCGRCGQSMRSHSEMCDRDAESQGDFGSYLHDYYQYGPIVYDRTPRTYIVPFEDYSGYEDDSDSEEFYRDSEWQSIHDLGDYGDQDFYWKDDNERECTSLLPGKRHYRYNRDDPYFNTVAFPEGYAPTIRMKDGSELSMFIDTSAIMAQSKTVFVEGIAGYHSIKLLDPLITAKSHAKMLNVYKRTERINGEDKSILRIGGLSLFPSSEYDAEFDITWTQVTARCGHHACRYQDERRNWKQAEFTLGGYELSRSQMEDFVYSLIRHGNNHAAPWFRERTMARASRRTLYSSTKIGETVTGLTPWKIEIPKDTPTFYKLHKHACDLSCDPTSVVC